MLQMNEFKSKEIEDLKAQEEVYWRRQMQYHKENLDESFQVSLQTPLAFC